MLLLQSGVALAHCLRAMAPADGLLVELCAVEGKRLLLLGRDGAPIEAPQPAAESGFCPACHGLPQLVLPAPALLVLAPLRAAMPAWHAAGEALRLPPARAPPYATRAPPASA